MFGEKLKSSDFLKDIVRRTFPDYKGRTYRLYKQASVTLSDLNWSGGTRSWYAAVNVADMNVGHLVWNKHPMDPKNPEGTRIDIPPNMIVVEHSHFCGKDMGLKFYVNPESPLTAQFAQIALPA